MAAKCKITTLSLLTACIYVGAALLTIAQGETAAPPTSPTAPASQSASQLQALVAPIALYPDSLVAQILTASTFPDQIAIADYWQNKTLTGSVLMQSVDAQNWDASVKALTEFPSVLSNMAKNLAWTSSLDEAYHDQHSEVMANIDITLTRRRTAT